MRTWDLSDKLVWSQLRFAEQREALKLAEMELEDDVFAVTMHSCRTVGGKPQEGRLREMRLNAELQAGLSPGGREFIQLPRQNPRQKQQKSTVQYSCCYLVPNNYCNFHKCSKSKPSQNSRAEQCGLLIIPEKPERESGGLFARHVWCRERSTW